MSIEETLLEAIRAWWHDSLGQDDWDAPTSELTAAIAEYKAAVRADAEREITRLRSALTKLWEYTDKTMLKSEVEQQVAEALMESQ